MGQDICRRTNYPNIDRLELNNPQKNVTDDIFEINNRKNNDNIRYKDGDKEENQNTNCLNNSENDDQDNDIIDDSEEDDNNNNNDNNEEEDDDDDEEEEEEDGEEKNDEKNDNKKDCETDEKKEISPQQEKILKLLENENLFINLNGHLFNLGKSTFKINVQDTEIDDENYENISCLIFLRYLSYCFENVQISEINEDFLLNKKNDPDINKSFFMDHIGNLFDKDNIFMFEKEVTHVNFHLFDENDVLFVIPFSLKHLKDPFPFDKNYLIDLVKINTELATECKLVETFNGDIFKQDMINSSVYNCTFDNFCFGFNTFRPYAWTWLQTLSDDPDAVLVLKRHDKDGNKEIACLELRIGNFLQWTKI